MRLFRSGQERIHDEAARWIARIQADPGPADLRAFISWYNADERHAKAYDGLARLWHLSPGSSVRSPLAVPTPAAQQTGPPAWYALAAVLVLGVGLAILLATHSPPGVPDRREELFLIATAVGEIREVELAEGMHVTLDTGSELQVTPHQAPRRLELRRGRARITAAAHAEPLLVQAGAARVQAENAIFDISLDRGSAVITSVSGALSVDAGSGASGPAILIAQNQTALVLPGEIKRAERPRHSSSWPSGMLEFDDAPLGEVIAEANRYSGTVLRLGQPSLASLQVTGAFRATDVEGLARSLAAAFGLELDRTRPGELVLQRSRR